MKALILGVTGQDGSYLAEILLEKGYEVHGLYRRSSTDNLGRIKHLEGKITLHKGDLADISSIEKAILASDCDVIYNVADQDSVPWSYETPGYSMDVTAGAVAKILEAVKQINKGIRFFQPCSAMVFGDAPAPQNEETRFNPLSPYAVAKASAYYIARYYRQVHGMFVSTAILYNHDSPRRSEEYLLHKICYSAVRIARGKQTKIKLGDLDAIVDIGYARDYMETVVSIMEHNKPDDFVVGHGTGKTIRDLVFFALSMAGISTSPSTDIEDFVEIDPGFKRPGKPQTLIADTKKLGREIGYSYHLAAYTIQKIIEKAQEEMNEQELVERFRHETVL